VKVKQVGIKCLECGNEMYSNYTHDWKKCTCGAIFVDGGHSYLRFGTTTGKKWEYCERFIDKEYKKEYVYYVDDTNDIWIQNWKIENALRKGYKYLGQL
jgi:hypothetical protein